MANDAKQRDTSHWIHFTFIATIVIVPKTKLWKSMKLIELLHATGFTGLFFPSRTPRKLSLCCLWNWPKVVYIGADRVLPVGFARALVCPQPLLVTPVASQKSRCYMYPPGEMSPPLMCHPHHLHFPLPMVNRVYIHRCRSTDGTSCRPFIRTRLLTMRVWFPLLSQHFFPWLFQKGNPDYSEQAYLQWQKERTDPILFPKTFWQVLGKKEQNKGNWPQKSSFQLFFHQKTTLIQLSFLFSLDFSR